MLAEVAYLIVSLASWSLNEVAREVSVAATSLVDYAESFLGRRPLPQLPQLQTHLAEAHSKPAHSDGRKKPAQSRSFRQQSHGHRKHRAPRLQGQPEPAEAPSQDGVPPPSDLDLLSDTADHGRPSTQNSLEQKNSGVSPTAENEQRAAFLSQYGHGQGYELLQESMQQAEFSRLGNRIFVDHAGSTLYASSQLQRVFQDLQSHVYGNPHSLHGELLGEPGSSAAESEARQLTLHMCNAPPGEYVCIFTSGATGALRLVAEAFPWSQQSSFVYLMDNHNSVLGIRETALQDGASAAAVTMHHDQAGGVRFQQCSALMSRTQEQQPAWEGQRKGVSLFAMPAESNFSGVRYDPAAVRAVQACGVTGTDGRQLLSAEQVSRWLVVLDAAKACATAPPDLSTCPADFVALSFYKIFGYPSGLGALLARRDALPLLRKRYFGGGAVAVSIADADFARPRQGAAGFEDGTSAFLSVAAVRHGFAQLQRAGGFSRIEQHVSSLTRYLAETLQGMQHADGRPVCVLYGAHAAQRRGRALSGVVAQGPVVTFNVLRSDGSFVGHREVEKLAALNRIYLRTGAFCNPGACALHLSLTPEQIRANFEAGHVCWDDNDLMDGRPIGAVRVSFGYMSTFADAAAVVSFVREFFCSAGQQQESPSAAAVATPLPSSQPDADRLSSALAGGLSHEAAQSAPEPSSQPDFVLADPDLVPDQPADPERESSPEVQPSLPPHSDSAPDDSSAAGQPIAPLSEQQAATTEQLSSFPDQSAATDRPAADSPQQLSPQPNSEPLLLSSSVPHEEPNSTFSSLDGSPEQYSAAPHDLSRHYSISQGLEAQLSDAESSAAGGESSAAGGESSGAFLPGAESSAEQLPGSEPSYEATPAAAASGSMSDNQAFGLAQTDDAMPITNAALGVDTAAAAPADDSSRAAHDSPQAAHDSSLLESDSACPVTPAHSVNPLYDSPHPSPDPTATNPLYSEAPPQQIPALSLGQSEEPILEAIFVYPIKSCAGFSAEAWPLGPNGLLYDREWALVDESGSALTQKRHPKLAMLRPRIDLQAGTLVVSSPEVAGQLTLHLAAAARQPGTPAAATPLLRSASGSSTSAHGTLMSRAASEAGAFGEADEGSLQAERLRRPSASRSPSGKRLKGLSSLPASRSLQRSLSPPHSPITQDVPQQQLLMHTHTAADIDDSLEPAAQLAAHARHCYACAHELEMSRRKASLTPQRPYWNSSTIVGSELVARTSPRASRTTASDASAAAAPATPTSDRASPSGSLETLNGDSFQRRGSSSQQPSPSIPDRPQSVQVCSDNVYTMQVGELEVQGGREEVTAQAWLAMAVGVPSWLVRQQPGSRRSLSPATRGELASSAMLSPSADGAADAGADAADSGNTIGFANEGQFLLLNAASLLDLQSRVAAAAGSSAADSLTDVAQFRPNFVAGCMHMPAFCEDAWRFVKLGPHFFRVTGPCARCEMVCVNVSTGTRTGPEPLLTLARYRRNRGRIHFGVLLDHDFSAIDAVSKSKAYSPAGVAQIIRVGMPLVTSS